MENNKVYIFLDIDGVLNAPGDKIVNEMFEENKLKMFIDFALTYNAEVVITSNRRMYQNDVKIIRDVFKHLTNVTLLSEKRLFKYRGQEIEHFIKQNKVVNYVIFDDVDNGISIIEELSKHFVVVNYLTGLTKNDLMEAIKIII